jgi:outer membrane receptor protein involved in Fe transport
VRESLTETGLYAIAEAPLADWATLELGARRQWNSRFDAELVPQVALVLQPLAWLKLRGSWGTSYRTPSLRDLFEPPVPNLGGAYFLAGNPELEPEHAVGLRGGLELSPSDSLWLSATFFTNRIDDFIRSSRAPGGIVVGSHWVDPSEGSELCQIIPDDPACQPYLVEDRRELFVKTNLDQVRTSGVEASLRWLPHPNVDLRAGYTFLDTWVKSELLPGLRELPNEPRYTVDLDATLTAPRVDTQLTLRARWRDGALTESSGTGLASVSSLDHSDPSWMLDLRLRQPLRRGLSVYLDLHNLLNTKAVDSYEVRGFTAFAGVRLEL